MALQTANQFQLGTDFSRLGSGIQQGQKIANQFQTGQQNKAIGERDTTKFDQEQSTIRATVLNKLATSMKTVPAEQRQAFLQSQAPELAKFNIDGAVFAQESLDDASLDEAIAGTQSFIAQKEAGPDFTLGNQRFTANGDLIAIGEEKPPATTSLEKNLVAAGFTPGTEEFQAEVLKNINKPKGTQITIGGEKKFQEAVQKAQAGTFARIGEEADAAIDANQSLSVLESIDVETGALEPAKQGLAAFATAFGLDGSKIANVAKGEGFNAEAKRLVLAVKASQKGPQTDKDESTIRSTVANLGNTKAGNQFIIDSARALNNRRIERKEFYDKFIEDSGGKFKDESGQTADRAWSKFKRNTPMISSNLRTPEGLPVFFYKFESDVRNANPDASRSEIIEAWNTQNKGAK
jgi:hypothetical protein